MYKLGTSLCCPIDVYGFSERIEGKWEVVRNWLGLWVEDFDDGNLCVEHSASPFYLNSGRRQGKESVEFY